MKSRIQRFLSEGGDFEDTALALYRWQRDHCETYDRFCAGTEVDRWQAIPAVPTTLFRDLSFACFDIADATVVFRTSGTTTGRQGVIHLADTDVYDLGARLHAERCLGPLPTSGVSLVSTASDSSLGHMCTAFVPDMPSFFSMQAGVDAPGAWSAIAQMAARGEPMFVPGTAFALADLLDRVEAPCPLPEGSVVMVTGGFKGRRRSVPEPDFHRQLGQCFPGVRIVGEYGMSELASQLWADPVGSAFVPPPWMRVQAVDPWTGASVQHGLLRFVDLANHQSALAIETQDVGTVHADGSVTLEGRLPGAVPRGCSLTVEEADG